MQTVLTVDNLRSAFIDVLEGMSGPDDVHRLTGCPMDRCQHIWNLYLLAQLDEEKIRCG